MGLFSKKKKSHTIEDAIKNDDVSFEHTTSKGNTYKNFPSIVVGVENSFAGFDDIDDLYEMFAPNLMRLLLETNQNVKIVMQQNSELQQKCKQLEQEIAELKSNSFKNHQSYQL